MRHAGLNLNFSTNGRVASFNKQRLEDTEKIEIDFWLPFISRLFDSKTFRKLDTFNPFDFVSHELKVYVEVKNLTDKFGTYPKVPIGTNKIVEGVKHLKDGYQVYFLLRFAEAHIGMLDLTEELASKFTDKVIFEKTHKMIPVTDLNIIDKNDRITFE